MKNLPTIAAASAFALLACVALPSCGESSGTPTDGPRTTTGGTRTTDGAHEGDAMRSLGTVEIASTVLAVSVSGTIAPSSEVHANFEVASGPVPSAVRFWIGDEAGTGAIKSKADGHDSHFHGHADAPASLEGASLWIEVETQDGQRHTASLPLE